MTIEEIKPTNKSETIIFFLTVFFLSNLTLFSKMFTSVVLISLLDNFSLETVKMFNEDALQAGYKI